MRPGVEGLPRGLGQTLSLEVPIATAMPNGRQAARQQEEWCELDREFRDLGDQREAGAQGLIPREAIPIRSVREDLAKASEGRFRESSVATLFD